jgi:HPt (histidine-containing phosphotransfer) domain-containing protein
VYLDTAAPTRTELLDQRDRGDLAGLRAALHRLKSAARSVGGHRLARIADEIEAAAAAGDQAACLRIAELVAEFDALCTVLEQHRITLAASP